MTPREVLRAAADYIEKHGHRKYDSGETGGPCCVIGACGAIGAESEDRQRAYNVFRLFIGEFCIADWNDAPERTAAEVVDAMRKAAES